MKKLLSLLLLFAMLLTGIPFAVSAEDVATVTPSDTPKEALARTEYHDLYVQHDLVGLFTAFAGDSTVSLSGGKGTWQNRVTEGSFATLAGTAGWSQGTLGGVGYTLVYGEMDTAAGTWSTSSAYDTYSYDNRLVFDLGLLPTEDFTVEYLACYTPVYAYDTATAELVDAFAESISDYNTPVAGIYSPVDAVGFLCSYTTHRGGYFDASGIASTQGLLRWRSVDKAGYKTWAANGYGWGGNLATVNRTTRRIASYAITRDETTVTADGATLVTATYTHFFDTEKASTADYSSANTTGENRYYTAEDDTEFYLSRMLGTDFYAVRVYADTLTAEEMKHNRAVDVMSYYAVEIPKDLLSDATFMEDIYSLLADEALERDAVAFAAARVRIQESLDEQILRARLLDRYAAKEHLTALFTTFVPDTVDLASGTWTDIVAGKTATLSHGTATAWTVNESGAVGYNTFYGVYADSDGDGVKEVSASADSNTHRVAANRLQLGLSLLPASDFSVEYMAMYKPVYVYDATEEDRIARDENGKKRESFLEGLELPLHVEYPIDQLGWFTGMTTILDSTKNYWGGAGSVSRGTVHWQFDNPRWYYGHNTWYVGGMGHGAPAGLNNAADGYQTNDAVRVYGIYLDETLTVASAEDGTQTRTTTALFSTYRDGVLYSSNANALSTTDVASGGKTYYDIDTPFVAGEHNFWLSSTRATDFFTVRVYDIALSDAQKRQNYAIDIMLYYGVSVPDALWESEAMREAIYGVFADETALTDTAARAAKKLALEAEIAALEKMSATSTLYVQDGLRSLFTAFAGEGSYLTSAGNDLLWQNRVLGNGSATFEKMGWTYNATLGGVGYDLIYGTVDTEARTFSATCTQDTYVRGNRLNLGLDLLPTEDFTLEYVAYYSPVLSYDSATGALVDTYGTGIPDAKTPTAGVYEPVDTVGFLSSYTTQHGGYFYVTSGVNVLGLLRWRSMDKAGYKTWEANGYGWGGSLVTSNRASRTVETYAITRDEETKDGVVTAVYTHRLGGAFVDDNSFSSANTTGEHRYYDFEDNTEFYLSYRLGTTFYALRVYDRVLSEAEQKQNRMADLFGFYGITVPDGFLASGERYDYVASLCEEMTFARDSAAYNANKTLLQTAVTGEGNTVTLIVDGIETVEIVYGDSYLLPDTVEGKTLFAWRTVGGEADGESYAPGQIVSVTGGVTLRAILFDAPVTKYGVSIKPMANGSFGMRFTATLDRAEYVALAEEYGQGYIRLSMLITPKVYVDRAGAFTREALRSYVEQNAGDPAKAFIEIPLSGFYSVDEDVCTVAGTIYNFTAVTREKNLSFAAIACVEVDTDHDGRVDKTVYGEYSPATCRSPKGAVEGVRYSGATLTDTQKLWLDTFLEYYQSKTYGEEGDKTVSEQREEIQNAFESAMNTVVDYTVHPFAEGEVDAKYAHIQAISFDGLTVGGKKTRVFAYLGLPEGASAENPVPAVVLVHGGGGNAYMEWVRRWNERGYAAIAMENTGYFPVTPGSCPIDSNATAAREFPDYILEVIDESEYVIAPPRNTSDTAYKEVDEHWQYHGLSAVILSHNVLRQQAEVDASRIGTVGVSWGGTMVTQVIGYDTRYAFAIPAYGSAYLGEPERPFGYYDNAYIDELWAAERNLDNFKNPILWFDWADDNNFVVNAYSNSYLHSLKNNKKTAFVLLKDWGHSHNHVWNKEHGYAFADSICFPDSAAAYARFTSQPDGQSLASTVALPAEATNVKVRFHYLTEPMVYKTFNKFGSLNSSFLAEYWKTNTADIAIDASTGQITGTVPEDVRSYYISVTYVVDGVSLETSSRFVTVR